MNLLLFFVRRGVGEPRSVFIMDLCFTWFLTPINTKLREYVGNDDPPAKVVSAGIARHFYILGMAACDLLDVVVLQGIALSAGAVAPGTKKRPPPRGGRLFNPQE